MSGYKPNGVIYNINDDFITVDVYKHFNSLRSIDIVFIFSLDVIVNLIEKRSPSNGNSLIITLESIV